MKHVAALLLLKLGGKDAPDAAAIKAVIEAAGGEADEAAITSLLGDLEGKVRRYPLDCG
jgi:ribosomal protein L12E/L44/L45/RPP1/RPP2